eukprot:3552282-Pleurochrysis_carterae.AAC.1
MHCTHSWTCLHGTECCGVTGPASCVAGWRYLRYLRVLALRTGLLGRRASVSSVLHSEGRNDHKRSMQLAARWVCA